ncbi:MAG: TIGR02147 family protein [Bdellovibrio sp.]
MKVESKDQLEIIERPVVYDYRSPSDFLTDLMKFYKSSGSFSLRQRTAKVGLCSQALVSQILQGKRHLNRDNLPSISAVFKLTQLEQVYLDEKISAPIHRLNFTEKSPKERRTHSPKNHVLSDWLHPYVKDLVNLDGFCLDSDTLLFMLQGIAPVARIKKSVEFLLREGFWKKTLSGQVIQDEAVVTTTNGIPNENIKRFHKKALEIALHGLKVFPINKRKASTVLIAVDEAQMDELKGLMDSFQQQLLEFIETHPNGKDALVQITTHLTTIGRSK